MAANGLVVDAVDAYLIYFEGELPDERGAADPHPPLSEHDNPTAEAPIDVVPRVPSSRRGSSGSPGLTLLNVEEPGGPDGTPSKVIFRPLRLSAAHGYACWVAAHYTYGGWSPWSRKHAFVAAPPRRPPPKPQTPSTLRAVDCTTMELYLPDAAGKSGGGGGRAGGSSSSGMVGFSAARIGGISGGGGGSLGGIGNGVGNGGRSVGGGSGEGSSASVDSCGEADS